MAYSALINLVDIEENSCYTTAENVVWLSPPITKAQAGPEICRWQFC